MSMSNVKYFKCAHINDFWCNIKEEEKSATKSSSKEHLFFHVDASPCKANINECRNLLGSEMWLKHDFCFRFLEVKSQFGTPQKIHYLPLHFNFFIRKIYISKLKRGRKT